MVSYLILASPPINTCNSNYLIMQLKNLGNSITAINELQNIFGGIKNISRITESKMEALQKLPPNIPKKYYRSY